MSDTGKKIAEIAAQRDAARDALGAAYDKLFAQKDIYLSNPPPLDPAKLQGYDDGLAALLQAKADVSAVAADAIENSADAKALADQIDKINTDLKAAANKINGVAGKINEIGAAVKQVTDLVSGALALAAMF